MHMESEGGIVWTPRGIALCDERYLLGYLSILALRSICILTQSGYLSVMDRKTRPSVYCY